MRAGGGRSGRAASQPKPPPHDSTLYRTGAPRYTVELLTIAKRFTRNAHGKAVRSNLIQWSCS